ncbi:MAG: hypothetical protein ACK4PH_09480 [Aquincola tertiaricarbonis]
MTLSILAGLLLGLAFAVLADTFWVVVFRAQPVGRFKRVLQGTALVRIEGSAGAILIYPRERRLEVQHRGRRHRLAFDDIRGLEYRVEERPAWLQELFFGLDITDLLSRYQDTVDWFSIALLTHGGERVPLYLSGRWQRREFALGWYIDAQQAVLQRLGLMADVERRSRDALDTLRRHLGDPPLL